MSIPKAFILAAGLGTRLRPLTDSLPKPLIPVGLKPLITYAFDHLIAEAGTREFIVNTHHLAAAYDAEFPDPVYRGRPLHFRHEPTLLETGGGIRNISDLLAPKDGTLLVYNGDILTDLPLAPAIAYHRAAGNEVTLVLRSRDGPRHIAFDSATGRIRDIRNRLGTDLPHAYAFSCIYLVERGFLERIPLGQVISVIPFFLEMIRYGAALGGIVIDEGEWRDLGTRDEYLRVHRDLFGPIAGSAMAAFPRYGAPATTAGRPWIDARAQIAADAIVRGACAIGAHAEVGPGATIEDTILWSGAKIASRSELKGCIVRTSQSAGGIATDRDF